MHATPQDLENRARDLFAPDLAEAVAAAIRRDAMAHDASEPATKGLATLFLADRFYARLGAGRFEGLPTVCWNGMDDFVFVPDAARPFQYTTAAGRVIRPRMMQTNGGTIPRLLGAFTRNLSPWGYAPAYIVHDWLFVAHACGHAPDTDWTFGQSAEILAEAIKTMMETGFVDFSGAVRTVAKAEDILYAIYQAVRLPQANTLWDNPGPLPCYGA